MGRAKDLEQDAADTERFVRNTRPSRGDGRGGLVNGAELLKQAAAQRAEAARIRAAKEGR